MKVSGTAMKPSDLPKKALTMNLSVDSMKKYVITINKFGYTMKKSVSTIKRLGILAL